MAITTQSRHATPVKSNLPQNLIPKITTCSGYQPSNMTYAVDITGEMTSSLVRTQARRVVA